MPTPTYDLIASNVLSSSASSVTFSSIPATYRDLVLVMRGVSTTGQQTCLIRINSDSGANYRYVVMGGTGSTALSGSATGANYLQLGQNTAYIDATNNFWSAKLDFLDYSATDKHKFVLVRENNAALGTDAYAYRWSNTAVINSLVISLNTQSWASGSSFYLYGIVS